MRWRDSESCELVPTYDTDVAEQHRAARVDAESLPEVHLGEGKLLLFVVDHAHAIPGEDVTHTHTRNVDRGCYKHIRTEVSTTST